VTLVNERDREDIIVVSGIPRSGTSMMMQMVEAAGFPILADDKRAPDDANQKGYYELEAVKASKRDTSWVAAAPGHAVKVIHALLPHLPTGHRYRVVLMKRDLREVVASQTAMLEAAGQSAGTLPEARLVEIFSTQFKEARRTLDETPCFEWIEVEHADLLRGDDAAVERVAHFLDRPARTSDMAQVVDQGLYRSRSGRLSK
jgi:hypothetical protein